MRHIPNYLLVHEAESLNQHINSTIHFTQHNNVDKLGRRKPLPYLDALLSNNPTELNRSDSPALQLKQNKSIANIAHKLAPF